MFQHHGNNFMNSTVQTVAARPTKRFFVSMLTRDIELKDAILDLLDNCVDGIHRHVKELEGEKPYEKFWAKITASTDSFAIEDNCGGIPFEIALKKAFMLGRPEDQDSHSDLHTVGMYGIGMKRAIFKLGKQCSVFSNPMNENKPFRVDISPDWMSNDEWELPITFEPNKDGENGTKITVVQLNENIKNNFSNASTFLDELSGVISQFYAVILEKGFAVELNGNRIIGAALSLLDNDSSLANKIEPYVFKAEVNKVLIEISIGFRTRLKSERETDDENEQPRTSEDAGLTVICNDRVVLFNDKSYLTGWGRGSVPKYHTQFISISGFVSFQSTELFNLPLTTTKRGLDSDNRAYIFSLDYMMEGIKKFVDFTNKWKGREEETNAMFEATKTVRYDSPIKRALSSNAFSAIRKQSEDATAQRYSPKLPLPEETNPKKRIVYTRLKSEIDELALHLYPGIPDVSSSDIGNKTFDICLEMALKGKKS